MIWYQATTAAVIGVVILILLAFSVRIANEYERGVVFRLGRLVGKRGPGLYLLMPFIERQVLIDLRIVTAAVEKQESITKDNVPVKVDAVVWYCVADPAKSVVRILNVYTAVTQISLTTLRNIIGRHTLDDVLKEKDKLAEEMRKAIDDVTEALGRPSADGRDEGCGHSRIHAARHGAGGRSAAREAGAHHQGRG